jgi:hypothetical protein
MLLSDPEDLTIPVGKKYVDGAAHQPLQLVPKGNPTINIGSVKILVQRCVYKPSEALVSR